MSSGVLKLAETLRPVLKKILPQALLSSLKQKAILRQVPAIKKQLEPYVPENTETGGADGADGRQEGTLPSVNLIGNIKAPTGLGQSCRLVGQILETAGVPFVVTPFVVKGDAHSEADPFADREVSRDSAKEERCKINLIHVAPSEFPLPFTELGIRHFSGHYNIAYWLWELQEFPKEWEASLELADEIWTPSSFITRTLQKVTDKPVRTIPYPVVVDPDKTCDRKTFGLPSDRFLILAMYDGGSRADRKNPAAAILAYRKAFEGREDEPAGKYAGTGLVLKVHEETEEQAKRREELCAGLKHVFVIKGTFEKSKVDALTSVCDVFVSLHRAEGFGLVMAEAMALGTPVIATDWSANTEFMDTSCACMVRADLVPIRRTQGAFKKGMLWAQPDTDEAAEFMRHLYADRKFYAKMKATACQAVNERLGEKVPAKRAARRLQEIAAGRI